MIDDGKALQEAYAEGREDQRQDDMQMLAWAYGNLLYRSFSNMDDALMMDRIKLFLEHGL